MSSFIDLTRRFAWGTLVAILIASQAQGADPKVVKASHVQTPKVQAVESGDAKGEDLTYSPQWPAPPNTGAILTRMCLGTFGVLGLCVVTLWLGKPWIQRFQMKTVGTPNFFIEGTLVTGNRATLYLVRVGNTQLVAGIDAAGLKALIALPPTFKEVLDQQVPEVEAEQSPQPRPENSLETAVATHATFSGALARPFAGQTLFRSGAKD